MKKFSHVYLGAIALALATSVSAGPRPNAVDSTSFAPGVIGTPLPVQAVPPPAAGGGLPVGYREYTFSMGNRALGADVVGLSNAAFYIGLRYPLVAAGPLTSVSVPCAGYAGPGELQMFTRVTSRSGSTSNLYWVCEPTGSRTILQKIVP